MKFIFYDFETSDLLKLGQILNFSFVVTDNSFKIIDEYSDHVRIEKTVLPRAKAILANQIDVIDHQKKYSLSESLAASKIHSFLSEHISDSGKYQVVLLGYNSARFDLKFLHTTFIRNGLSPYLPFQAMDLFFASQKLYHSKEEFNRRMRREKEDGEESASLSLQSIAQEYGLITGKQKHESRADVMLTIEVARLFVELGCDIRTFRPFEPRGKPREGSIAWRIVPWPNVESETRPYVLLSDNGRNSLWADLDHAKKCDEEGEDLRESVRYIKHDEAFFLGERGDEESYGSLIESLLKSYGGMSASQFFLPKTCDIEEQIYRIPFNDIQKLHAVFEKDVKAKDLPDDYKQLYLRYRLRNYEWGGEHDEAVRAALREFSEHRFGGSCELFSGEFLPTYSELRAEVIEAEAAAESKSDKKLMQRLLTFYDQSEIADVLSSG